MLFEIEAQVKKGFGQCAFDAEQEGDQESSEASVTIEKRMNRFKLDVTECCLEKQRGSDGLIMKEFFQFTQTNHHFFGWRWNESRIAWTSASDPVLRPSEFARCFGTASSFGKKNPVNLSYQSQRKRESASQSFQPVIECRHVLRYFLHVVYRDSRCIVILMQQEVGQ
jgi:hypothetical protein